jgi:hypothetical protein
MSDRQSPADRVTAGASGFFAFRPIGVEVLVELHTALRASQQLRQHRLTSLQRLAP